MTAHEMLLAGIAAGALLAWVVLLVAFVLYHPTGATAVAEGTGDEPPALVNFLVNRCRSTRAGYPATILDLAARGYLTVTDRSGQPWCAGPRGAVDATRLEPVDAHVLARTSSRLSGVDGAPFSALAGAQSGVPEEQWWKPFQPLVRAQAQDRGLVTKRLSPVQRLLLLVAAVPVAILAANVAAAYSATSAAVWASVIVFPVVVFGVASHDKSTAAGRALARRWAAARRDYRVTPTDPDLARTAYAIALGLPHPANAGFTASDRPTAAWSSLEGTWRLVPVERRPRRIRRPPVAALVVTAVGTAVVASLHQLPGRFAAVVAVVLVAGWVWVVARGGQWLSQRLSTPPMVDFDGQLIARWQEEESSGEDSTVTVHYGAVDDGARAWTWVLDSAAHWQVPVGSAVHVRADPRRGKLIELWVRAVPVAPAPLAPVLAANAPTAAPGPSPSPAVDVAALFTTVDASRILGHRFPGVSRAEPNLLILDGDKCRFMCIAFAGTAAALSSRVARTAGTPVPELGPDARLTARGRGLAFRLGPAVLQMTIRGMPTAESGPALIALARLAMSTSGTAQPRDRLPG